jgi:hypothetical protein
MAKGQRKKSVSNAPWVFDPRRRCLGPNCINSESSTCYDDVHDVDILDPAGFPYRICLCARCREGLKILHDRGCVNETLEA